MAIESVDTETLDRIRLNRRFRLLGSMLSRFRSSHRAIASVVCALVAAVALAQPLAYRDFFDFNPNGSQGQSPSAITFDAGGDMYGTAEAGGAYQDEAGYPYAGVVWEITASGSFKVLHNFGGTVTNADGAPGPDGIDPRSPVLVDGNGDLFGTAYNGGPNYDPSGSPSPTYGGMIWEITAAGVYKDLHDFGGTVTTSNGSPGLDGQQPNGVLYRDASGDLFGVANYEGYYSSGIPNTLGGGMLWELTAAGVYKDLHDFGGTVTNAGGSSGPDGWTPEGGVSADSAGDLFGTTIVGGPHYNLEAEPAPDFGGVLWEFTAAGSYRDLHDFGGTVINGNGTSGPDGQGPDCNVTVDASGNRFGTTRGGGPNRGSTTESAGILWELTAGNTYRDLHDFGGTITNGDGESGPDGSDLNGPLAIDASGDLIGAAEAGGANGSPAGEYGMVWELTPTGQYTDLHDFGGTVTLSTGSLGTDGAGPTGVTIGPNGHLYGSCGGFPTESEGGGMVWEMLPQKIASLTLSPSTIGGLGTSTGMITLAGESATGWTVNLRAGASGYLNLPPSVTVAAGATTATFTITGTAQRSATLNMGIVATDSADSNVESILTIQGDEVNGLSFSPSTIGGSGSTTATVTISSAAPADGWIINMKAAAAGYLSMPAAVTVPAGATSTTFTISGTTQRTGMAGIGVIASDGNASVESILTVQGDLLKSIVLSPTSMGWSGTSTGTVTLNSPAPGGGWVVNLRAGAPGYLSMPASVTIPAGATTATFSVTGASQRTESATIGVIANDTGNQVEADLTLTGDSLTGVSVNPTSVTHGGGSTGTVTLSGPAPVGGWVVKLWAGAPSDVQVPATVTVPAGAASATFSITTPTNAVASKYGIFANDGTSQFETYLTIT